MPYANSAMGMSRADAPQGSGEIGKKLCNEMKGKKKQVI
jgi:hypothetical protein